MRGCRAANSGKRPRDLIALCRADCTGARGPTSRSRGTRRRHFGPARAVHSARKGAGPPAPDHEQRAQTGAQGPGQPRQLFAGWAVLRRGSGSRRSPGRLRRCRAGSRQMGTSRDAVDVGVHVVRVARAAAGRGGPASGGQRRRAGDRDRRRERAARGNDVPLPEHARGARLRDADGTADGRRLEPFRQRVESDPSRPVLMHDAFRMHVSGEIRLEGQRDGRGGARRHGSRAPYQRDIRERLDVRSEGDVGGIARAGAFKAETPARVVGGACGQLHRGIGPDFHRVLGARLDGRRVEEQRKRFPARRGGARPRRHGERAYSYPDQGMVAARGAIQLNVDQTPRSPGDEGLGNGLLRFHRDPGILPSNVLVDVPEPDRRRADGSGHDRERDQSGGQRPGETTPRHLNSSSLT
jgi:hypothetical protein